MDKKTWLDNYINLHKNDEIEHYYNLPIENTSSNTFHSLLPIAMKISAKTIASGYHYESDERIQKRKRIKKLERILDKETFDSVVEKDEYDNIMIEKKDCFFEGLVSVQPMSAPSGNFSYVDYIYESEEEKRKRICKERLEKMKRILDGNSN